MAVELIIADVDGCLSPEESVAWDLEKFFELARYVRDACHRWRTLAPMSLCTGRPQTYVEVLMKILDIRVPAICENGAVIYTLHDNHARYSPGVTSEGIFGLREIRGMIEKEFLSNHPEAFLQFGKEAQLSVFSRNTSLFPGIRSRVEEFARERGGPDLDGGQSHSYINGSLKEIDKGRALKRLLDELGLDRDRAAGIGDTEGDLPLRDAVGFFACPSNSHEVIKSVADYISP